jgi:signal transduction histidine kinase
MADTEGSIVVDAKNTPTGFEIRVHDSGRGIPSGIRNSLFDPFVSSGKPNGTGLGLAIVSKIVQDHSGSVSIEQTSESGTTVLVRLPAAEQNVAASTISPIR